MRVRAKSAGFTLVEVIVSVTVSAFTLTATLAVVLFITRSEVAASAYVSQANDARRAIQTFALDVRQATDCLYNSASSITLTVPNKYTSNSNRITYAYDGTGSFQTTVGATTTVLCRNVTSVTFSCFTRNETATTNSAAIKLVQLSMNLRKTAVTTVAQDTVALSAVYVLRNKPSN